MRTLVAVLIACASMLGLTGAGVAASRSEGPTPDVLVASHGLQVIAETGRSCTKVYLSTDFLHAHARIVAQTPVELAVADVDRDHARRADEVQLCAHVRLV